MICRDMGGECDLKIEATTSAEMAEKMTEHVLEKHPKIAETMTNMTEEEHKVWEAEFHKNWDKTPRVD